MKDRGEKGERNMRVSISTILDPSQHGGLETYVRTLAFSLLGMGDACTLNSVEPAAQLRIVNKWKARISQLLPFSTRPRIRWISRWIALQQGRHWANRLIRNCEVVHFVGTGWDLAGFALARSAQKFERVMTCLPAVHPGTWGDSPLDIDLYQRMDAVFVLSDHEANHLADLGVPRDKLVRCVCAPSSSVTGDADRFRRARHLEGKKIVLFIARKSQGKGYHALRSAVDRLAADRDDLVLVSIGRDLENPYPELDSEIDIDLGVADEATKQDALAACDVFVLPSEAESFGIVYVEAWAYGKPVVCGTAPASRELVTRHGGGVLSDGTIEGIAIAICELLNDSERAQQMGLAGKKAVAEHYSIEKVINRHVETWERLRLEKQ